MADYLLGVSSFGRERGHVNGQSSQMPYQVHPRSLLSNSRSYITQKPTYGSSTLMIT